MEDKMKTRRLTYITATALFATLATPVRLAAQEQKEANSEHHRYRFVDIGTFGGPASFVNPVGNGAGTISSPGTVVGASATLVPSTPTSNGFVCGGLDGIVPFVFHPFK